MDQNELKIISRKEAIALGLKKYFTGKPCINGHIAERTVNASCIECLRKNRKTYRENNRDKVLESCKKYREENRDKVLEGKKKYRENNRDKVLESCKKYREENRDKVLERHKKYREENRDKVLEDKKKYREENRDKIKEYREENRDKIKEYRQKNRHIFNALSSKRRATKLQATPLWSDAEKLKTVYVEAKRLEKKTKVTIHTDHIVPLQGKNVCGLHVHYNLRNVAASDNLSKSNVLDESLLVDLYPNYWLGK